MHPNMCACVIVQTTGRYENRKPPFISSIPEKDGS